jgi:hypothetical protein
MSKVMTHTITKDDLNPDGSLKYGFVPQGLKDQVIEEGHDPNKVGFVECEDSPEGIRSVRHCIYLDKVYTLVYRSDKRKNKKIVKKFTGTQLLIFMENFQRQYESWCDLGSDRMESHDQFKQLSLGLLETWGRQKLGLSVTNPYMTKDWRKDVKKGDRKVMNQIFGYFGLKLSQENLENGVHEDKGFTTIEVLDRQVTEEDTKNFSRRLTKEESESMKLYGVNTWSFS